MDFQQEIPWEVPLIETENKIAKIPEIVKISI